MSDCERFQPILGAYVSDDLDDRAFGPLLAHCRTCDGCRELLELHRDLAELAELADLEMPPSETGFDAMRSRVLREVAGGDRGQAETALPWHLPGGFTLRAAAILATAAMLFVVGLAAGRALPGLNGASVGGNGGVTNRLVSAINADANSNHSLMDVEDSRFTYSNASFRRLEAGRVALDFDVTTHVGLIEPVESELVREVLIHSLLNPSSTGARLKAMSFAAGIMESKIKDALLFSMRRDDNLAVRLKALEILSDHLGDPEIESGVLAALRDDDSVQVRLLALDFLATHSSDGGRIDRIHEVIRESERLGDEALMVRLAEYQKQL